jgi:hypothetical protein
VLFAMFSKHGFGELLARDIVVARGSTVFFITESALLFKVR